MPIRIHSNGFSHMAPSGSVGFHCKIDPFLFPFDKHTCSMRVATIRYFDDQINLNPSVYNWYKGKTSQNQQWHVVLHENITRCMFTFGNTTNTKICLEFKMDLKRGNLYYSLALVFPVTLLSAIACVNFLLPISDPVRLNLSYKNLLAFSIYESIIINELPRSSNRPTLILIFLVINICLIAAEILLQGLNLYWYNQKKPANYVIILNRILCIGFFAIFLPSTFVCLIIIPLTWDN